MERASSRSCLDLLQVLILHIVDSFLRLPAVVVPERLHYKRRIYNSRRLCQETLVMDVATEQRTLPNNVEHWQQNITVPRRLCQETLVMDVAETRRWATGISSNSGCSLSEATFGGQQIGRPKRALGQGRGDWVSPGATGCICGRRRIWGGAPLASQARGSWVVWTRYKAGGGWP